MTTTAGVVYTTSEGDMLDEICYRHYGRVTGTVEEVYRANPALQREGTVLDAGIRVWLPALESPTATKFTNLWD